MIHVVSAPGAVFCVFRELTNQSNQALVDIELSVELDSGNIEVPMRSSAEVIIIHNVELDVIVEESALDRPHIEEDMDSEVAKEESQVLASSHKGIEPLAWN